MIVKNLLLSFAASIVLIAGSIGGLLYVQNYKDGTEIARAKAIETLASEREKIEVEAVKVYKASDDYREDACKLVAENITKVDCLHYMYVYIRSEDIKKYAPIKSFYNEVLKEANKQYKSYGK